MYKRKWNIRPADVKQKSDIDVKGERRMYGGEEEKMQETYLQKIYRSLTIST